MAFGHGTDKELCKQSRAVHKQMTDKKSCDDIKLLNSLVGRFSHSLKLSSRAHHFVVVVRETKVKYLDVIGIDQRC